MIGLLNYGIGNIKAFENIYRRLGVPVEIINDTSGFSKVSKLILPGVGSFDQAMKNLNSSGLRESLDKAVLIDKKPVLGICVGMQMMASRSDEGEKEELGLGWIPGTVSLIDINKLSQKPFLPHMGWNAISINRETSLFSEIDCESGFYFLHSYRFKCSSEDSVLAYSEYGDRFHSVVKNKNIFGVQFHPEKSHGNGIKLLENFYRLV